MDLTDVYLAVNQNKKFFALIFLLTIPLLILSILIIPFSIGGRKSKIQPHSRAEPEEKIVVTPSPTLISESSSWIAYENNGQIYKKNAITSGRAVSLTKGKNDQYGREVCADNNCHWPMWSPDGTKILFQEETQTRRDLYVINSDGNKLTSLTHPREENSQTENNVQTFAFNTNPRWSSDSQKIAFESNNRDAIFEIFIVGADGEDLTRLTDPFIFPAEITSRKTQLRMNKNPSWSSGDQMIFFQSFLGQQEPSLSNIYGIRLINEPNKIATAIGADLGQIYNYPYWTPYQESPKIVFDSNQNDDSIVLHLLDSLEKVTRIIPKKGGQNLSSSLIKRLLLSPKGNLLALALGETGRTSLNIIDLTGETGDTPIEKEMGELVNSDDLEITTASYNDLVWSPDGKYLAFWTIDTQDKANIYVVDIEKKKAAPLIEETKNIFLRNNKNPSFSSDGKMIVFYSHTDEDASLYTINVDRTQMKLLTSVEKPNGYTPNIYPVWSPVQAAEPSYDLSPDLSPSPESKVSATPGLKR